MKLLVDENIPRMTVNTLRDMGHDVKDLRQTPEQGISDEVLWDIAQHEKRLVVTTDKGFSHYRNQAHAGILIIRLKKPNRIKIHQRAIAAIKKYSEKQWYGRIVVMKDAVQSTWKFRK